MNCPCCSEIPYAQCCQPFHLGIAFPSTAEALMRSRYSAFAIPNGKYLLETTLPTKRKNFNEEDYHNWGKINHWRKLEIIQTPNDSEVEFKAYYIDSDNKKQIHHEHSYFKKVNGKWYYVSGEFLS